MAQQPKMMPVTVEGVGTFSVPEGTSREEILRLAAEYEQQARRQPPGTPAAVTPAPKMAGGPAPDRGIVSRAMRAMVPPMGLESLLESAGMSKPAAWATTGGITAAPFTMGGSMSPLLASLIEAAGAGTGGAAGSLAEGGTPGEAVREGGTQALIQSSGPLVSLPLKLAGKFAFRAGLNQTAPEIFGDLSSMVRGGPATPQGAMGRAVEVGQEVGRATRGVPSQQAIRRASGDLTSTELLSGKAAQFTTKAKRAFIDQLRAIIKIAPNSQTAKRAEEALKLYGLALAEQSASRGRPNINAALLGMVMGGMGAGAGLMGGDPVLAALAGGSMGFGIPMVSPQAARYLGKVLDAMGYGTAQGFPALIRLLQGKPEDSTQPPQ